VDFKAKFNRNRGTFAKEMRKRAQDFHGKKLSARISMPEGEQFRWWYWNEFGTALRGDAGRASGKAYSIDPQYVAMLRWPTALGEYHYALHVNHPGIHPRRMITKALDEVRKVASFAAYKIIIQDDFRFETFRQVLLDNIMPDVKNVIVQSISNELTQTRTDPHSKLHGEEPGAAFARDSFIRNTGS